MLFTGGCGILVFPGGEDVGLWTVSVFTGGDVGFWTGLVFMGRTDYGDDPHLRMAPSKRGSGFFRFLRGFQS